jgi:hypothetical protein
MPRYRNVDPVPGPLFILLLVAISVAGIFALLQEQAWSAQSAPCDFTLPAQPAAVIQWLGANRDAALACGQARVLERQGNLVHVYHPAAGGQDVWLKESVDARPRQAPYWAQYTTTLAGQSRKLDAWTMQAVVSPSGSGTRVTVTITASVRGLGDNAVQRQIDQSLRRFEAMLRNHFK